MIAQTKNLILQVGPRIRKRLKEVFHQFERTASYTEVERAEQIFYINYLREGMIVFDVGANIGELTLLFSRFCGPSGKVYSFEANSSTFEKLSTMCDLTVRKNIEYHHLAMADINDTVELYVYPDDYSSWNTLARRPLKSYGIDVEPVKREQVQSSTIDAFCQERGITNIDLLKIDVEGAEYQVLLGAHSMLEQKRVRCCVFEFGKTTFDMGNDPDEIEAYLEKFGYRLSNVVKYNPVFPGRANVKLARFSVHVAIPKE